MSIPSEPKIEPCPVCGAIAQYPTVEWRSNDEFAWLNCTCGMETTACRTKIEAITIWNRLSQGAQLLTAVKQIEAALVQHRLWSLRALRDEPEGMNLELLDGDDFIYPEDIEGPTLAEALIAQAQQLQQPPVWPDGQVPS